MKVTESWLREWVNPKQDIIAITDLLSLSGLEVDAVHTLGADHVLDINITPNRGDCLSVKGLARELAALTEGDLTPVDCAPVPVTIDEQLPVHLASKDCPIYQGRIIRGIDNTRPTPEYITDRLQQLGVRSVSLIVDLANYVMLELGQPLHAFDLAKVGKKITVRDAKAGEQLILLDETVAKLDERTLVIADDEQVLALAGVMGGLESGVSLTTNAIFIESAHFLPQRIAGKTRLFGINSDGAYRFERGVDPNLIHAGLEHVSSLILQHAGGTAGPITQAGQLPAPKPAISLSLKNITRLLGMPFPERMVSPILQRLGMHVDAHAQTWQVNSPSFRFDIALEEDLIEELARVYGYHHIPSVPPQLALEALPVPEEWLVPDRLRQLLLARGYHELITYSFVDHAVQALVTGSNEALMLLNPMSSQMDAMRTSVLPGLLQALCYNQNRQQMQMRLFEIGLCFLSGGESQTQFIAGVLSSQQPDKHWQVSSKEANFYDIKGDVEALLALTGKADEFTWQPGHHPALHPGQSAVLMRGDDRLGIVGQLHPHIAKQLDIKGKVFLFELQLDGLLRTRTPHYVGISKFPAVRRDLAVIVDKTVAAQDLCLAVKQQATELIKEIKIFDVYEGKGIAPNKKSVALGIVLQAQDRTLADTEINTLMQQVVKALEHTYQATIRD